MSVICGYCHHPGVHAAILPPGGGRPTSCADCPQCVQAREISENDPIDKHRGPSSGA
jgi:hypothetical protein